MTLDELSASVRRVLGAELPMSDPQRLTRTVGNSRQADRYRAGRVLLAGDAAHLLGLGGSLNTGLLDAVNLGWKLAAQVRGQAPDGLLDSYHDERHLAGQPGHHADPGPEGPVRPRRGRRRAARAPGRAAALRRAAAARRRADRGVRRALPDARQRRVAAPAGRPAAPDLAVDTPEGRTRVAELLRPARGVLLDFTPDAARRAGGRRAARSPTSPARMAEPARRRAADPARRLRGLGRHAGPAGLAGPARRPADRAGHLVRRAAARWARPG